MFKQYLSLRFSGKMTNDMKSIKKCLKSINTLSTPARTNFWMLWYENYLKELLKILRMNLLFIPKRYRSASRNALEKLIENDYLVFKDIKLPFSNINFESSEFLTCIIESLFAYLLDNVDKNVLPSIFFSLSQEGLYEYKLIQLEKDDIVIDAGANIGEFSALAGIKGCKVYAFEPMPNVIDTYLSKTAAWNPNITVYQYALSNKRGELFFSEHLNSAGGSSFVKTVNHSNHIKVKAVDLDTFAEENKLPRVDFIKADIEGAERYMLMGAKRVLKEFAPKLSICTYHLPDDPQVLRELILDANPNYVIEERWLKMYAHVPK